MSWRAGHFRDDYTNSPLGEQQVAGRKQAETWDHLA
jgi:hypothetical protein